MNQPSKKPSAIPTAKLMNRAPSLPLMVTIPAGEFLMGTSDEQIQDLLRREEWAQEWYDNDMFQGEQPQSQVYLNSYAIAKFPVTNVEYHLFVWNSNHRAPKGWAGFHYPEGTGDFPVVGVSLKDAEAYCEWLTKQLKMKIRLPNEAEWERAARHTDGRYYPWGNFFDPWRCNTAESSKKGPTPVGSYSPGGDSVSGVSDMAGNVWEWTSSQMMPYPFDPEDGRQQAGTDNRYVARGGAWYYSSKLARCAAREGMIATYISPSLGFRIARDASEIK